MNRAITVVAFALALGAHGADANAWPWDNPSTEYDQIVEGGWRSMDYAPHDGTTIEIRCGYGIRPWYGLYHWIETPGHVSCPTGHECISKPGQWAKDGDDSFSIATELGGFTWRPYSETDWAQLKGDKP